MRIKIDISVVDDERMEQTLLDVADQVGYAVKSGQIMGNLYDHKEINFVGTFEATED